MDRLFGFSNNTSSIKKLKKVEPQGFIVLQFDDKLPRYQVLVTLDLISVRR